MTIAILMRILDLTIHVLIVALGVALLVAVIRYPRTVFVEIPVWLFKVALGSISTFYCIGMWMQLGKSFFDKTSVTRKNIAKTQLKLGVIFPNEFKEKMTIENGGSIEQFDNSWTIYSFSNESDRRRLRWKRSDITGETKNARQLAHFPSGAVVIAGNETGDKLILLPTGNGRRLGENIHKWTRETGEVTLIAEDISHLV